MVLEKNKQQKSYYEILSEHEQKTPNKEAIVFGNVRLTYSDLIKRIDKIASALLEKGLNKGDKVVLWAVSDEMYLCTYFGIIRAGGVAVLLNSNLSLKDCGPLSEFAECRFAIFGKTHDTKGDYSEIEEISSGLKVSKENTFILHDEAFDEEVTKRPDASDWNVKDDAHIIYTSGTTSFPKAVLTSQYSMISECIGFTKALEEVRSDKGAIAVPLFHVYGLNACMSYLLTGGTIFIATRVKAEDIVNLCVEEDINDSWTVAVVYQGIIDDKMLVEKAAPQLKLCMMAGSYVTPVQFMRFESNLVNAKFLSAYGMSETSGAYVVCKPSDSVDVRYKTIGRAIEGTELGIWDENKGLLPPGEVGEIVTRGPHIKNSYFKLEEEKQAVDKDGWLHSGDLGVCDEHGNLRIVGRIKDIIIKGGENISPSEIESEACKLDGIKACRIFGYFDRVYGENLAACVQVEDESSFDEAEVKKQVKAKVGTYKTPVYFFTYKEFPLNASGKIDQRKLQADMLNLLKRREINESLHKGILVTKLNIVNTTYCITPVAAMIETYAKSLGFDKKRAMRIGLCMEEMLLMRVDESNKMLENIDIKIEYFDNRMQISTIDEGMEAENEKDDIMGEIRKSSTAIIAAYADDVKMERAVDGNFVTTCEFLFEEAFNIEEFLMKH